jgi:hypothetical protein
VSSKRVPGGAVHDLPTDLREALIANVTARLDGHHSFGASEFIGWSRMPNKGRLESGFDGPRRSSR